MTGLSLRLELGEVAVIDLREFGLGTINVMSIGNWKVLFNADKRIPIHRKEVFDAIERQKAATAGGRA